MIKLNRIVSALTLVLAGYAALAVTPGVIAQGRQLLFPRGTEAAPGLAIDGERRTGLYLDDNSDLSVTLRGNTVATFGGSGITQGVSPTAVNDLTDVEITAVANGHILQFDGGPQNRWENVPLPASDPFPLTVNTTIANTGVEVGYGTAGSTARIVGSTFVLEMRSTIDTAGSGGGRISLNASDPAEGQNHVQIFYDQPIMDGDDIQTAIDIFPNDQQDHTGANNLVRLMAFRGLFGFQDNATVDMLTMGDGNVNGSNIDTVFNLQEEGGPDFVRVNVATLSGNQTIELPDASGALLTDEVATMTGTNRVVLGSDVFANLGAEADGSTVYCSDCTVTDPCAGAGSGAFAKRINAAWVCN